jgi:hypothetical protein
LPFWLIILFGGAFEMLLGIQPEVIAMKTDQSLIQQLAQLAQVTAIVGGGMVKDSNSGDYNIPGGLCVWANRQSSNGFCGGGTAA